MLIRNYMKRNVVCATGSTTLGQASRLLVQKHVGSLPIIDDEKKLIGLLGLADILDLFLPNYVRLMENIDFVHDFGAWEELKIDQAVRSKPVLEFMRDPVSVEETTGLLLAYTKMLKHDLHDLPVVKQDGTLVGIASRVDIGTAFLAGWDTGSLNPEGM